MKITIEITSAVEGCTMSDYLYDLSAMISESKPEDMNGDYINWSGDFSDITIKKTA